MSPPFVNTPCKPAESYLGSKSAVASGTTLRKRATYSGSLRNH